MAVTHGHGNPNWTREEVILALDLYFDLAGVIPSSDDDRIRALSATLRNLPYHALAARKPSFRNPDGVSFKLQNLRQVATGKGLDNTSRIDSQVWAEFGTHPAKAKAAAGHIREAAASLELFGAAEDDTDEFEEGRAVTILHLKRERDRRVRKRILARRRKQGPLQCEICGLKSSIRLAACEDAVFEVHHTVPLSASGARLTRLRDMSLLCANCHRLLHRAVSVQKRWIGIAEAKQTFFSAQSGDRNTLE
jgi:5-methylcytosine-specific restriction protein A